MCVPAPKYICDPAIHTAVRMWVANTCPGNLQAWLRQRTVYQTSEIPDWPPTKYRRPSCIPPPKIHVIPLMKSRHCLPIAERIEFKILMLVSKCLQGNAPVYFKDLLIMHSSRRPLRSQSDHMTLMVPRSRTMRYGKRACSNIALSLSLSLSLSLKHSSSDPSNGTIYRTF